MTLGVKELLADYNIRVEGYVNGSPSPKKRLILLGIDLTKPQLQIPVKVRRVKIPEELGKVYSDYLSFKPERAVRHLKNIERIIAGEVLPIEIGDNIAFYTNSDCIKQRDLGCPGLVFRIVEHLEKIDSGGRLVMYNCPIFYKKE